MPAMAAKTTAWVFSGGGSLGAVQVGMLQALVAAQAQPHWVLGTSAGALNAAFFAFHPDAAGVQALAALWQRLQRKDIFPLTLRAGLTALLGKRDHVVEPHALARLIDQALGPQRIEQARIPLHVMATQVLNGAEYLLSHGDLRTALLASSAIPVVFPPVYVDGQALMDGSVGCNTPIASAIALGAQRVVVLPTGTSCGLHSLPRDLATQALHVLQILNMRQLDRDVAQYSTQADIVVVPPLCPLHVSVFDFSHTAELIERSRSQTSAWLADGGLERSGPLHVPLAHHHHHPHHHARAG